MALSLSGGGGDRDVNGFYEWSDVIVVTEGGGIVDWFTQFGRSQQFAKDGTDVSIGVKAKLTTSTYRHFSDIQVGVGNLTIETSGYFEQRLESFKIGGALTNNNDVKFYSDTTITGRFENNGLAAIYGNYTYLKLAPVAGKFTLLGSGDLRLVGGVLTGSGGGDAPATTLSNQGRISGSGIVGSDFNNTGFPGDGGYLSITNTAGGVIEANRSGETLNIQTQATANKVVNAGTLSASAGGTLHLYGSGTGVVLTVEQSGAGKISALNGGIVLLEGAVIRGGTLDSQGTGYIQNTRNEVTLLIDVALTATAKYYAGRSTILQGTIDNRGSIINDSYYAFLQIGTAGVTLTGGGALEMRGAYDLPFLTAAGEGAVLTNVNNTIRGIGSIGGWTGRDAKLTLVNQGTISARPDAYSNDYTDILKLENLKLINAGMLEARGKATLQIGGPYAVDLNNASGVIQAVGTDAKVLIDRVEVKGGLLQASGGGVFESYQARLSNLEIAKSVVLHSGPSMSLEGAIKNAGQIVMSAYNGSLSISAKGVTLTGGGKVALLDNYDFSRIVGEAAGAVLTNRDNLITGDGEITGSNLKLVNSSTIRADADPYDAYDSLVLKDLAGLVNTGVMEARNGATLEIHGTADGAVRNKGGLIQAVGKGSIVDLKDAVIAGGTLKSVNGGQFRLDEATFDGRASAVTADITMSLNYGKDLILTGTIVNVGDVSFSYRSSLIIGGNTTLSGGGRFTILEGYEPSDIHAQVAGTKLNNIDNTLGGTGSFGSGLAFTNGVKGVITANQAGKTLTVQTGNTIANAGVLAAKGGILDIRDKIVGAGRLEVTGGGTLIVDQGVDHRVVFTGATSDTLHLSTRAPVNGAKGFDFTVAGMGVGDRIKLDVGAAPNQTADFTFTAKSDTVATLTSTVFLDADGKPQVVTLTGPVSEGQFGLVGGADGAFGYVRLKTKDGTDKAETLTAAAGGERVIGLSGDDVLVSGAGNDVLDGSRGTDTVSYAAAKGGVKVSLETKAYQGVGGGMGKDSLIAVENLTGSAFADNLTGNAGANTLIGGLGNDLLKGQGGADILIGGKGVDTLYGGADAQTDTFVFLAGDSGTKTRTLDRIYDFRPDTNPTKGVRAAGSDLIDLRGIDGDLDIRGDQKLRFVDSFTKAASGQPDGQVSVVTIGAGSVKNSLVQIDWNGDNRVDMSFEVMRVAKLTVDDFLL